MKQLSGGLNPHGNFLLLRAVLGVSWSIGGWTCCLDESSIGKPMKESHQQPSKTTLPVDRRQASKARSAKQRVNRSQREAKQRGGCQKPLPGSAGEDTVTLPSVHPSRLEKHRLKSHRKSPGEFVNLGSITKSIFMSTISAFPFPLQAGAADLVSKRNQSLLC